jgi:hypothetical protein
MELHILKLKAKSLTTVYCNQYDLLNEVISTTTIQFGAKNTPVTRAV